MRKKSLCRLSVDGNQVEGVGARRKNGDFLYSIADHENGKAWASSTLNMASITVSTPDDSYCSTNSHRRNGQTIIDESLLGNPSVRHASYRATPTHGDKMLTQPEFIFVNVCPWMNILPTAAHDFALVIRNTVRGIDRLTNRL